MRAFWVAVVVAVVVAIGTSYVLESIQETMAVANATSGVRISKD